jgi:hypothetical protein
MMRKLFTPTQRLLSSPYSHSIHPQTKVGHSLKPIKKKNYTEKLGSLNPLLQRYRALMRIYFKIERFQFMFSALSKN